jgi:putative endopeptidase
MKKILLPGIFIVSLSALIISCSNNDTAGLKQEARTLSLANIDSSVKPGDNFFMYANGKWFDTATIPPAEARIGAGLEMYNRTKENIRNILESVSKASNTAGSIEQKVGDLYASGMDSAAIEKAGYDPIKPSLQKINDIKDIKGVLQNVAEQTTLNNNTLFEQFVWGDEKNTAVSIVIYYQGGLGLPDRDYYFKADAANMAVVKAYQDYIQKVFMLTGDDSATASKNMMLVYELEKKMAAGHRTNVELREPVSNYNKMAVADLEKKMPAIGWSAFLKSVSIQADSVNVGQPGYYQKLNDLLKTVPVDSWKPYLRFHVIHKAAPVLSNAFVQAHFDYTGKALAGRKQMKERWERVYRQIDANIGEALGELYVKKYFTDEAKKRMLELVNNLQKAFEARVSKLDWMSDSTKAKAKEKSAAFTKKIGYPDKWRDYSKVTITRNNYFENLLSCNRNEYSYQAAKVGKPVDRTEWAMTPPTIDAYNNSTFNEIVFPAGILQYPMFDVSMDDALNYGGIGMVIGHEITHAFDDQGAQYDKNGNMHNWWAKEDYERFKARCQQVIKLYNSFVVLDSVHINGDLTQGENTADIGGLAIAYDAFKMTKQGQDTTKIDGYTPDQRFFLSFAQSWRRKLKDEAVRTQVNTDPHSPPMYRVWGPVMNFTPFYTAFNVKEGDKMFVPEKDRITIW